MKNNKRNIKKITTKRQKADSPNKGRQPFFLGQENLNASFHRFINITFNNLEDYYALVKHNSKQILRLTLFAGIAGFVLIISGLTSCFLNPEFRNISYISTVSGIFAKLMTAVFICLYIRSNRLLKKFHKNLLITQNTIIAIFLTASFKDSDLIGKIIEFLFRNNNFWLKLMFKLKKRIFCLLKEWQL